MPRGIPLDGRLVAAKEAETGKQPSSPTVLLAGATPLRFENPLRTVKVRGASTTGVVMVDVRVAS